MPETAPALSVRGLRSPLAGPYDLSLAAGECVVIGGPSGSGKSLLLRMICDLDPNTGEAAAGGVERASLSGPEWRARVPYVAAEAGWWTEEVADHVAPALRDAARRLADRLGLRDAQFDGRVARLSTGEKQRLALIRGLVLETPVLLLDEPTSALDRSDALAVEAVLKERLAAGAAVLMVSHDTEQARRLSARRYRMEERRLTPVAERGRVR